MKIYIRQNNKAEIDIFIKFIIYVIKNETNKKELLLKIDFSSFETVDKFIDLLKDNNIEIKEIGKDEYLVQI